MRTVGIGACKPKKSVADVKLKRENEQLKSELDATLRENEQLKSELDILKCANLEEMTGEKVNTSKK